MNVTIKDTDTLFSLLDHRKRVAPVLFALMKKIAENGLTFTFKWDCLDIPGVCRTNWYNGMRILHENGVFEWVGKDKVLINGDFFIVNQPLMDLP